MSQSILHDIYLERAQGVRRTLATWRAEHPDALSGHNLEDLVRECLRFPDAAEELRRSTVRRLADDELADMAEARRSLQSALDGFLEVLEEVHGLVVAQARNGNGHLSDLTAALARLRQVREQVFRHWPELTIEEMATARAGAERGEGLDMDDVFAEVAGVDRDAWLRRVEEHKRTHHA